jgi:hypothetical protein
MSSAAPGPCEISDAAELPAMTHAATAAPMMACFIFNELPNSRRPEGHYRQHRWQSKARHCNQASTLCGAGREIGCAN